MEIYAGREACSGTLRVLRWKLRLHSNMYKKEKKEMFVRFFFMRAFKLIQTSPMRATGERKAQGIKMYRHLILRMQVIFCLSCFLFFVLLTVGAIRVVPVTKTSSKLAILVPHTCHSKKTRRINS